VLVVVGPDPSLATAVRDATDAPVLAVPTSAGAAGPLGGLGALLAATGAGVPATGVDDGGAAGLAAAAIGSRATG
jgi:NCAIR mutase (PurE)-related protein